MINEAKEILSKLWTQIDGVEAYLRQLDDLADRNDTRRGARYEKLGRAIRVQAGQTYPEGVSLFMLQQLRENVQTIEDELNAVS